MSGGVECVGVGGGVANGADEETGGGGHGGWVCEGEVEGEVGEVVVDYVDVGWVFAGVIVFVFVFVFGV